MSNCRKYEDLIDKLMDGAISESKLSELKAHAEVCRACREELDGFNLMRDVVVEAFCSSKSGKEAGEAVVSELSGMPHGKSRDLRWVPRAIAAGILLAVGVMLGLGLGKAVFKPDEAKLADAVDVTVANIKGTVLVRHVGCDTWEVLERGSTVRVGDTFHSAAKSDFILRLDNRSTIEVDENSMLVLKSYNDQTQFFLAHGECTAALGSPHGPFFIETPHGRVEALGTEFTVTVE